MPVRSDRPFWQLPFEAETLCELVPQLGAVQLPGGLGHCEQVPAVKRGPGSIGTACHVRNENVSVQVRVAGAARPMKKRRGHKPVASELPRAARTTADDARLLLQPSECSRDRVVVTGPHSRRGLAVGEREEDRDRLGRGESEIEAGGPIAPGAVEAITLLWMEALEHREQIGALHDVGEIEGVGVLSEPPSRRFTRAQVVVLAALGNAVEVVGSPAGTKHTDAEHHTSLAGWYRRAYRRVLR